MDDASLGAVVAVSREHMSASGAGLSARVVAVAELELAFVWAPSSSSESCCRNCSRRSALSGGVALGAGAGAGAGAEEGERGGVSSCAASWAAVASAVFKLPDESVEIGRAHV